MQKPSNEILRRLFLFASCCISLLVMYFSFGLILWYSISTYPIGSALLIPWAFGLFGIAGLLRSWPDAATKSRFRLRMDLVLLCLGIIGALIFAALEVAVLRSNGGNGVTTAMALFPLMPIVVASFEIRKILVVMRNEDPRSTVKLRNIWLIFFLVPLAIVSGRILCQELIIMWYGRDLVPAAYAAAEKIARGAPYCVVAHGGVDGGVDGGVNSFEEIDKRRILLEAIKKRMGVIGRNAGTREPHFGIAVNGKVYWWSFKKRDFSELYGVPKPFLPISTDCG